MSAAGGTMKLLSTDHSRGTLPILFRHPSFQKTTQNPGKQLVFEKNDG